MAVSGIASKGRQLLESPALIRAYCSLVEYYSLYPALSTAYIPQPRCQSFSAFSSHLDAVSSTLSTSSL